MPSTHHRLQVVSICALTLASSLAVDPAHAQWISPPPQVWTQADFPFAPWGLPESGDSLGSALTTGDFNGDGIADLAVGVPGEDIAQYSNTGVVHAFSGTAHGSLRWSLDTNLWGMRQAETWLIAEGRFGSALASGDFDGDGYDDLAVGIPGVDSVQVFFGSIWGPWRQRNQFLWKGDFMNWAPRTSFGEALAAGDFDGDGYDDLAVGDPTLATGGAVHIFRGGPSGIRLAIRTIQQSALPNAVPATGDRFGAALIRGDFEGDGYDDLAVGAPGKQVDGAAGAGAVWAFRGTYGGLDVARATFVKQGVVGSNSGPEAGDAFGTSLAAGDITGDGRDDLAVGAPGESFFSKGEGALPSCGAVSVFYSGFFGVTTTPALFLNQSSIGGGTLEAGDQFGMSVALLDNNGDFLADLYVGVPGENGGGAYQVFVTSPQGVLPASGALIFQPGTGATEPSDRFGRVLAGADFDANGRDDIVISAPLEDLDTAVDAGQVHVHYSQVLFLFEQ